MTRQAIISGKLAAALGKRPGACPAGAGKIWRRLQSACCKSWPAKLQKPARLAGQLCAGPKSGAKGAAHAAQEAWGKSKMEDERGFLLIDASSAFNKKSQKGALWAAWREWPKGHSRHSRAAHECNLKQEPAAVTSNPLQSHGNHSHFCNGLLGSTACAHCCAR